MKQKIQMKQKANNIVDLERWSHMHVELQQMINDCVADLAVAHAIDDDHLKKYLAFQMSSIYAIDHEVQSLIHQNRYLWN